MFLLIVACVVLCGWFLATISMACWFVFREPKSWYDDEVERAVLIRDEIEKVQKTQ